MNEHDALADQTIRSSGVVSLQSRVDEAMSRPTLTDNPAVDADKYNQAFAESRGFRSVDEMRAFQSATKR